MSAVNTGRSKPRQECRRTGWIRTQGRLLLVRGAHGGAAAASPPLP